MVVNNLMEIGFSAYEARAYLGLLKSHPATAYEIAKASGLPTSKIYEVLARLLEKGVVMQIQESNKKRFLPLEPGEFVKGRRAKIETTLSLLNEELPLEAQTPAVSYIWNITSYADLMRRAGQMVSKANSTLLISAWKEEIKELIDNLKKKENEGVRIALLHFGQTDEQIGQVYVHPIENTIYAEKGGRGFVLVADTQEALMGTVFPDARVEGAWSKNSGFVTLAEDYIKHDIYINKIVERFNQLLIDRFGNNYHLLRDIFQDEEVKT
jgi:sugar-specific transcriptional regulator TrmB